jgi:hypothetical protein
LEVPEACHGNFGLETGKIKKSIKLFPYQADIYSSS